MENTDIPDGTRIQVEADEEPLVIDQRISDESIINSKSLKGARSDGNHDGFD